MKTTLCAAFACALLTTPLLAQTGELNLPGEVKALIPPKTEILHVATADLDGDELPDYIVAAQDPASADPEDPTRTVFVIQQKPEGEFRIVARNDRAVISRANGGLSDSFEGITAEKKQFTLLHSGGRRDKWTASYTFGYSRIDNAWQLIRVEGSAGARPARCRPSSHRTTSAKSPFRISMRRNGRGSATATARASCRSRRSRSSAQPDSGQTGSAGGQVFPASSGGNCFGSSG